MLCRICNTEQDIDQFQRSRMNASGHDHRCRSCRSKIARQEREENYFLHYCRGKKSECKRKGYDFDLTPEYLESIWTGKCPVFSVDLFRASEGMGSHKSAHLDRLDPSKGYLIGNVAWISGRANRIKYDATAEELRKIADWMEGVTTSRDECSDVESSDSKQGTPKGEEIVCSA